MKRNIYLFCNEAYGSAYLAAFQTHAKALPDFDCRVVFSTKATRKRRLHRLANAARHPLRYALDRLRPRIAETAELTYLRVPDVNSADFCDSIPMGSIGFICGFNQIFGPNTIARFASLLNFHPSLLPYYRGAIPSYWVIRHAERITGFSAHVVTPETDAGEIVYQEAVTVDAGISEAELDRKIARTGAVYFVECLDAIAAGKSLRRRRAQEQYAQKIGYTPPDRV